MSIFNNPFEEITPKNLLDNDWLYMGYTWNKNMHLKAKDAEAEYMYNKFTFAKTLNNELGWRYLTLCLYCNVENLNAIDIPKEFVNNKCINCNIRIASSLIAGDTLEELQKLNFLSVRDMNELKFLENHIVNIAEK